MFNSHSEKNTGGSSNDGKHHLTGFSLRLLSGTKPFFFSPQQNNFKVKVETSSIRITYIDI